jgi:hypothetical protein
LRPDEPGLVKLFCGILYSSSGALSAACSLLKDSFGIMDYRSPEYPFNVTDYYVPEMGKSIIRLFVSFEKLVHPGMLASIKIETNRIEESIAEQGKRKVNLDPGYLDYDKAVLASAKYNGQKIYLDHGIWADLTLHFEKGRFDPYPWSFPDFKSGLYDQDFLNMRQIYKMQKKRS